MPDPTNTAAPADAGRTNSGADPAANTGEGAETTPKLTAAPPPSSERYSLGAEIARGGMGVVYRATDTVLAREVAVKVLQDKYAPNSGVARRFADEARITGQLQHPNIPAVHDLGVLPDGRPFLAMKLIKGETLDELLKARQDVSHDRGRFVAAFEKVCEAMAYAHAHGVIHRDLKPANIMVGAFGEVQVMDWGLAKVLGSRPSTAADPDETAAGTEILSIRDSDGSFTQAGSVLGTPAFMSPEQAVGAVGKVDTRSDVFGLGAVLAVILTGEPPFAASSAETTRVKAAQGDVAECLVRLDRSGADPELIALGKRCLSPKPVDRPAHAGEVAQIVAGLRMAADERVRRAERERHEAEVRTAEQAKRRRAVQRVAGIAVAVLLLGVAGTTAGLLWANTARNDADRARQAEEAKRVEAEQARLAEAEQTKLARAKEVEANAVVKFFQDKVFAAARPKGERGGLGKDVSLQAAIVASLPALDGEFQDQPLVAARLRSALGATFYFLGDFKAALNQDELAHGLYVRHLDSNHPDRLRAKHTLAFIYRELGRSTEALPLFEEVLAAYRRLHTESHRDRLITMRNLAACYNDLGRLSDGLKLSEEVVDICKRAYPPDHPELLSAKLGLASRYHDLGRHTDALPLRVEVVTVRRSTAPDHPETLEAMYVLACTYLLLDRIEDGLKLQGETLVARQRVLPPDHPATLWSLYDTGNAYRMAGRPEEALPRLEAALAGRRRALPPDHPDTLFSMRGLASCYADLKRNDDSLKIRQELLAASERTLPPDHPDRLMAMYFMANGYVAIGRYDDAAHLYEVVLAARRRVLPTDHPSTLFGQFNMAECYARLGRHAEALQQHQEALAGRRRSLPPLHSELLESLVAVAESLGRLNRGPEALPLIDEFLAAAVGKQLESELVVTAINLRLRHFEAAADPAGCRTTAEKWEALNRADADSLFHAGRLRAVAAGRYTKASQPAEARTDADRAIAWLTKAAAAGYLDRWTLETDGDLNPLRDRADFQQLVREVAVKVPTLPEPAPPPRATSR